MKKSIGSFTKKQIIALVLLALVFLVIAIICTILLRHSSGKKDKVYVQRVSDILSEQSTGSNKYMGIIESEGNKEIEKDADRKIQEVFVHEGDEVLVGTKLFAYDVEEAKNAIEAAKIEIESSNNSIADYNDNINKLEEELKTADEERQKFIDSEIKETKINIRDAQLNINLKKSEIEKNQKIVDNGTVVSTVTGVVKTINKDDKNSQGNTEPFIVIYQNDKYKVKGLVEEETARNLKKDQEVVIRSRINEDDVCKGKITEVSLDKKVDSPASDMGQEGQQNESSSKYPFYVELEGENNFLLGEHVYIDTDLSSLNKKKGLWLDSSYVVNDDKPYVWVESKNKTLEKRNIKISKLDEASNKYKVLSGLKKSDYIASDIPGAYEGISTVRDQSKVDYKSPLYRKNSNRANPIGT
ncbi:efflux RND transporter periplasmic adaptor subunit [Lachnobacterium bovis]|uniref:HlyD family secretion protein n=1 Tax=Lachnobacterium bovis TaxID=140626 RepID=A0A1H9S4C3_9FIRM|nr:efflux RND transporter periplasmic adaptor subunit [Lachnobacterium bovis]SER78989.1 HlyD family secretion protein [Lachnobacterium bovis]